MSSSRAIACSAETILEMSELSTSAATQDWQQADQPNPFGAVAAVILAGGLGTRLRPVVDDRPKVLADVDGRPFLTYLLDQLCRVGIQNVVLCTGYQGQQVSETFGDSYRRLHLQYSREPVALGTGGALRLAASLIASEWILAMNGDSYCAVDLHAFWEWHRAKIADASIVLIHRADASGFGRVEVDADGRIQAFTEKGAEEKGTEEKSHVAGEAWISAGIYLLRRSLAASIPLGRAVSIEREIFPQWINKEMYGYRSEGFFLDIGTPETYNAAQSLLSANVV